VCAKRATTAGFLTSITDPVNVSLSKDLNVVCRESQIVSNRYGRLARYEQTLANKTLFLRPGRQARRTSSLGHRRRKKEARGKQSTFRTYHISPLLFPMDLTLSLLSLRRPSLYTAILLQQIALCVARSFQILHNCYSFHLGCIVGCIGQWHAGSNDEKGFLQPTTQCR
jgi:hypothetical protein